MDGRQFSSPARMVKWSIRQALMPLNKVLAPLQVRRYLASTTTPRLHFGCSLKRAPGWLNSDVTLLPWDWRVYLNSKDTPWTCVYVRCAGFKHVV